MRGGNLGSAAIQQALQVVGSIGCDDGVVIDQVEQRRAYAVLRPEGRRDVCKGNGPITGGFGADEAQIIPRPVVTPGALAETVGPGAGMFRIKIFIRGNVAENIQVTALWPDAVIEQPLVVLDQVPEHKAAVEVGHLAAVPMVHERDGTFFPIAKAGAWQSNWRADGIFFVDGELRDVRRRIQVLDSGL